MKPTLLLSFLLFACSTFAVDDDICSKVASPPKKVSASIDPDSSIYGVPLGTTEDDFIATHGKPTGYLRLSDTDSVMIYGKSHAFIFEKKQLAGVRITFSIIDWKLSNSLTDSTPFDQIKWRLTNGIESEMNLKEVKKILGETLTSDRYEHYYNTDKARVELEFSHYVDQGEVDEAYKLRGIFIRTK